MAKINLAQQLATTLEQAGKQPYVLPRNHQQVHGSGCLQQRPVITAQTRAVTHDQRRHTTNEPKGPATIAKARPASRA